MITDYDFAENTAVYGPITFDEIICNCYNKFISLVYVNAINM